MRFVLSLINAVCKVIAWGLALTLGLITLLLVITVISIMYSISMGAGFAFLGLSLLIVWMIFYAVKD